MQSPHARRMGARTIVKKPIAAITCPSRRDAVPFAKPADGLFIAHNASDNPPDDNKAGRSDYAVNAGDTSFVDRQGRTRVRSTSAKTTIGAAGLRTRPLVAFAFAAAN